MNELAVNAARILREQSFGTLATLSQKHPGWPFASIMPYALTPAGEPLFFISGMAVHTRNLLADGRASLLVLEEADDAVTAGRVTVMGNVERIESDEDLRSTYLGRHPSAAQWMGFGDFSFFRLSVTNIYYVAGFGSMGWITPADYREVTGD